MYGIGAYFAIQNAIKAFNPQYDFKISCTNDPRKSFNESCMNNV